MRKHRPDTDSPDLSDIESLSPEQLAKKLAEQRKEIEELQETMERQGRKHQSALSRRQAEQALKPYQAEVIKMQRYLEEERLGMIVLFEGRDASGKGGTIRRMTRYMNEKHYRVVALGKPTEQQRTQWYFQRYVEQFPRGGETVLFDRSWYNRAVVEPIFGFCTDLQYQNFMVGVTGFEKDIVRQGIILVKLYFSVSKEEQRYRFERRKTDPLRQWKLSEVDLQAQDRWDDFSNMKYAMLKRTHTAEAPWTVIRSDDKLKARLNAIKVVLNAVPFRNRNPDLDFRPDSEVVVSGAVELELMEAQRINQGKFTH
ncbi:MAG: polyphosphate kinase 2 [Magnetococcales bacterium]|nr:polyphosphate kinase 2 [Magnetococcales bacterium]